MTKSIRYTFRLTQDEDHAFHKRYAESGISSISEFIRQAALTTQIKPPYPQDLFTLRREVQFIGNNINQIAKVANASGMVSKDTINELLMQQKKLLANVKALF